VSIDVVGVLGNGRPSNSASFAERGGAVICRAVSLAFAAFAD
jgi:hypothetical protein